MSHAKMKELSAAQLKSPRFIDGKALLIGGLRKRYSGREMNEIPAQWQRFAPHIGKIAGQLNGDVAYGVCWPVENGDGIEYLTGIEVSGFAGLPSEFTVVSIPPVKYAVFLHREHVSKLRETIDAIFHTWLPGCGHQAAGGYAETPAFFERYTEEFNPQTGIGGMEVWVPLKS